MENQIPTEGSIFEPKTAFPWQGVIHYPTREGSPLNRADEGSGAQRIEVSHDMVMAEIEKGLHPVSKRPNSGLLNHCFVVKAGADSRDALATFYGTVEARKSARKKRLSTAPGQTHVVTEDEKIGRQDPTPKKQNNGGRPKKKN